MMSSSGERVSGERPVYVKPLAIFGIWVTSTAAIMAPVLIFEKDDERGVDDSKAARVIKLDHQSAAVDMVGGKIFVPQSEEWNVTVEQCQPDGQDCATDTIEVPEFEFNELREGQRVIPGQLSPSD